MTRPYRRFTPDEKLNIVLRHLRGESQGALHRQFGCQPSQVRKWKNVVLEAARERLGKQINPPCMTTRIRNLIGDALEYVNAPLKV